MTAKDEPGFVLGKCPHGWHDQSHCLNCTADAFRYIEAVQRGVAERKERIEEMSYALKESRKVTAWMRKDAEAWERRAKDAIALLNGIRAEIEAGSWSGCVAWLASSKARIARLLKAVGR